jgi:hypothetical protein
MSTVGTVVRDPGIVWLPIASSAVTILRGQLVAVDSGTHTARLVNAVAGTTTERVVGIATSDSDPDLLSVAVATKGGYTMSVVLKTGDVASIGTPLYQDGATFSQVSITAVAGKDLGWCVNPQRDALGNVEMAFFLDVEV